MLWSIIKYLFIFPAVWLVIIFLMFLAIFRQPK